MSIRETGGDWIDALYGDKDPILKGEKDAKTGHAIKIPDRDVGPSSTQVPTICSRVILLLNVILFTEAGFSDDALFVF